MTLRRLACLFSFAFLLGALPASAQAGGHVASATGEKQVNGKTLYVDVVVAVPVGQPAQQATHRALADKGARSARPAGAGAQGGSGGRNENYFYTGLKWAPPSVTQNY